MKNFLTIVLVGAIFTVCSCQVSINNSATGSDTGTADNSGSSNPETTNTFSIGSTNYTVIVGNYNYGTNLSASSINTSNLGSFYVISNLLVSNTTITNRHQIVTNGYTNALVLILSTTNFQILTNRQSITNCTNHTSLPVTVFSDDFNRADSSTVGNGWTFTDAWGSGVKASISNNSLKLSGSTNDVSALVSRPINASNFVVKMKYIPGNNAYTLACVFAVEISGNTNYSFQFQGGRSSGASYSHGFISFSTPGLGLGWGDEFFPVTAGSTNEITFSRIGNTISFTISNIAAGTGAGYSTVHNSNLVFYALQICGGFHNGTTVYSDIFDDVIFYSF